MDAGIGISAEYPPCNTFRVPPYTVEPDGMSTFAPYVPPNGCCVLKLPPNVLGLRPDVAVNCRTPFPCPSDVIVPVGVRFTLLYTPSIVDVIPPF